MATLANPTPQNDVATLNPALRDFWLARARNKVLIGGRASSKSWDAGGFATFLADNYKLRILCVRQFQNRIEESVYALLKIQISRFKLNKRFSILKNKITNRATGTEFMFYGLWRSIDEIKSLEGIDILWIEEAHNLTEEQWKILEPTIRNSGSQVWIIFNPKLATDFAYKRFVVNPPPDTIVRLINYPENPFLSETMLKIIRALKAEDGDEHDHVYLGVPRQDDDGVIIKRAHIMAAIDAHKTLKWSCTGSKRIGYDVADGGFDKCAQIYAHGSVASWSDLWKAAEDELLKSCKRVYNDARSRGASVTYDSIGVGAHCGAKFNELNTEQTGYRLEHRKFNAGGAVFKPESIYSGSSKVVDPKGTKNKDMFCNIKAQAWWMVADRFRNTYNAIKNGDAFDESEMISIDSLMPNLELLIDELSTPKRDFDKAGKVKVESKDDLKEREIPSPNLADAFIMAFAPGITPMKINPALLRQGTR